MKDCGIVKDLLPLVAEHMASEESAAFVKEHLKTCEDCRKAFEEIQAPVAAEPTAPLKTVRKTVKRRGLLIAGFAACLVAALLVCAIARLYKPIVLRSSDKAFASATVAPETIPLPAERTEPQGDASKEAENTAQDEELVKAAQQNIVILINEELTDTTYNAIIVPDGAMDPADADAPKTSSEISFKIEAVEAPENANADGKSVAYFYLAPKTPSEEPEVLKPDAVIESVPRTLKLTPEVGAHLMIDRNGGEISIAAYTTLWDVWLARQASPQDTKIDLSDVDAVFFEPYDNTDREILYQREGYAPEAGFALPRLVMNYYFAIALIAAAALFIPWLVLLLCKKRRARRIVGALLLIPAAFALAFLAAGFPATTIAPLRELLFVLVIALLLIGAGLCGRKLFEKA